ncbi:MFS transporter [Nocardia terpenica]|uniref:MFS transporter n=1 Tax=Nocardia terpenica TaxID=455432 RepID=A0A164PVL0_9NOCA|nr:MFS transporter [Nocardia terpenica]KZM76127.1 MFS transporter [Nocardia terpenica]NQE85537.1 MFS transporter [Nocardia terpenica]
MDVSTLAPPLRIARVAVFAVFGFNGFLLAMWVVHIPVVTEHTGVSHATLGMLILLMAGGSIVGMRAAGPLADRWGSRTLVTAALCWGSLAVLGPGLAGGPVALAVALAAFGFGNGALDVSMNAQAVQVERQYGRPIMSAFHALFSCGGLVGSLAGAAAMRAGFDIRITLGCAAALGGVVVVVCAPRLLPRTESRTATTTVESPPTSRSRRVLGLAAVAFALLMAEGVANDWSALQVREHLGVADATAALAFGAFSTTMTIGRFGADRVSARFGRVAVVRWGCLLAAAGLLTIMASPWVPLTLAGWALMGIGLAGGVPQIFTVAGNLGSATAATDMSRVFGLGYFGLLAGPSVIGWLSKPTSLTVALVVPLAAVLLCAYFARVVADS